MEEEEVLIAVASSYEKGKETSENSIKKEAQEIYWLSVVVKNKSPINDLSRLVKILSRFLTQEAFGNMKRHLFLYLVPLSNTEKTIRYKRDPNENLF